MKIWGWQAPKPSQPFSMAWPGIVLKVFGLSNVRRKSALNRLSQNVNREIRYTFCDSLIKLNSGKTAYCIISREDLEEEVKDSEIFAGIFLRMGAVT